MEVSHSYIVSQRISKDFIIDVDGVEIAVNVYIYQSDNESDDGWDFIKPSDKEAYNNLSSEKQQEFVDFVNDLEMS